MKVSANIQHNVTNSAPTVNDDSTKGYSARSWWLDTSTETMYFANSVGVGAAVWNETGGGGDNLYTANGTLAGARTVTMAGNGLTFDGGQTTIKGNGETSE